MSNKIKDITILTENTSLFTEPNVKYIIPLYQRAFAWKDFEITQLIEDIRDFEEDNYYIGSLIVSKNGNSYEVIDGQQRLTALFLLFKSLDLETAENILSFACRKKSDFTLSHINDLEGLKQEEIEASLQIGKEIIDDIIMKNRENLGAFKKQLSKVKLYRIEVPKNTDLNRYFEIMNTRGEQLEQHDILKAKLMSYLSYEEDKSLFAKIWEACSDMTGYVQMHFNTNLRAILFNPYWVTPPTFSFKTMRESTKETEGEDGFSINKIIGPSFSVKAHDGIADKDERVRFESIITFPYFLLHTLKVLVDDKTILNIEDEDKPLINEMLDDKKLVDSFDKVIEKGSIKGVRVSKNKEKFSKDFIKCLIQCRYLFDKFIIKREFTNENTDGVWSLKELIKSTSQNNTAYYVDTDFGFSGEWGKNREKRHKPNLMLQACLRVSYTSPKIMHWITEMLIWLYFESKEGTWEKYKFSEVLRRFSARAVKENYLNRITDNKYNWGTNTPHIVFNFLDYLLWERNKIEYKDFVFEFRNSVEHWYPRNASNDTFETWTPEEGVDNFGNLCLLQRNTNSKFSNLSPFSKKENFRQTISKGSLKLREMASITKNDQDWKNSIAAEHESKMLKILIDDCDNTLRISGK